MKDNFQLRSDIADACQQVHIAHASRFLIGNVVFNVEQNMEQASNGDERTIFENLAERLTTAFYGDLYTRRNSFSASDQSESNILDLNAVFQQVNDNKDGWDPGWMVYKVVGDGRLLVQKGDRSRGVLPGEYSTYKWPGVAPKAGDLLSIRTFSHSIDVQPAFFFAFGRTLNDQFDDCMTLRFYFNVSENAVVDLMRDLTRSLNQYYVPFKFKALVDSTKYCRADAAVLYVARRYYCIVASVLKEIYHKLQPGFRQEIPLFTKRLCDGIGMAEEPEEKGSFGMHRSAIVARAIVDTWQLGSQEAKARMATIEQHFAERGLSLERAYLNPKSEDVFDQFIFEKETRW